MKHKGGFGKKRWLIFLLVPLFCLLAAAGFAAFSLTREPRLDRFQMPNAAEAFEANKKLKILDDSLRTGRKGYIRLSELEINSLIEVANKKKATNSTAAAPRVRTTVLLTTNDCTFITWHKKPLPFFTATLPMQRKLQIAFETNKPSFRLQAMKIGRMSVPESMWGWIEQTLDPQRALVAEKLPWMAKPIALEISENEVSKTPEFKLYSYMPSHLKR